MTNDSVAAIEALLMQAEAAHGVYEAKELNGVYDAEWTSWYARYAVENGLDALLGRDVGADEVRDLLAGSWEEQQRRGSTTAGSWAAQTASALVEKLGA